MGTSLNVKNDDTCRLAGELARLTGRKDTIMNTLHTRLKNPLTRIMIFVLLLVCSIPAWGNPLHDAAGKGDTAAVKALLETGADVEGKDNHGWTALQNAAGKGHIEIVKALLTAGAAVNEGDRFGWTVLHGAVLEGHTETVKALLAVGAAINAKQSDGRMHLNTGEVVNAEGKRLLTAGAAVHAKMDHGNTALHLAAMEGHTEIVKMLKAAGGVRYGD